MSILAAEREQRRLIDGSRREGDGSRDWGRGPDGGFLRPRSFAAEAHGAGTLD